MGSCITSSAYAAAPGPLEVELNNDDKTETYGEEAETSRALFMSGHFVFPPNQHENLLLEPDSSEKDNEEVQKDAVDEISTEEVGRSRGKGSNEEENLILKGLELPDEFAGIPFSTEKDYRLPIGGTEYGEGTTLEGLNLVDKEEAVMGFVILGQRWQNERWQALQHKWQFSVDQKTGRVLGPISRLKDVIVGGQRRGSFIRGSASSEL